MENKKCMFATLNFNGEDSKVKIYHSSEISEDNDVVNKFDEEEKVNFLIDESINHTLCIKLLNKEINCFGSLVNTKETEIIINESLDIDEEIFVKLLLGKNVQVEESLLFNYFLLFQVLKMKKFMYYICNLVSEVQDIKILNDLLSLSVEKFEEKLEDEGVFKSVFTLIVVKRIKKLDSTYLSGFTFNSLKKVGSHKDIKSIKLKKNLTSPDIILNRTLKDIYSSKIFYNLTLTIKVHKEILILKSNFFSLMFKFQGVEYSQMLSNHEVNIIDVEKIVLSTFLEYIYTNKIKDSKNKNNNLIVLIKILYFSEKLKNYCCKRISFLSKKLKEEGKLKREFDKFGYLLVNHPVILERLKRIWNKLNIDSKTIKKLILRSVSIQNTLEGRKNYNRKKKTKKKKKEL